MAKETENPYIKTILRGVSHAMVASDCTIKAIHLLYPHDTTLVTKERLRQINLLQQLLEKSST